MDKIFYYKIHSTSLGDTLAATPILRKLFLSYNKKINVITKVKEVFLKNPYIDKIYDFEEFETLKFKNKEHEIFESFLGLGGEKNKYGVEKKHNTIDIRQFHAIDLGFMLHNNEMEYDYVPDDYISIDNLPIKYVCMHVSNTWPSRTYSDENWQQLIDYLNKNNIPVVLIGKNSSETGFYNIDKKTKILKLSNGLDLTNKLNLSQCWHVINKAQYLITMDSGMLHLAGTTDVEIIQLGSSINNKLRAPFRKNSQDYKYKYVSGPCDIFCASDIKYGVKEWKTIQGVPPLINCLENKKSFECHPSVDEVIKNINFSLFHKENNIIDLFNYDASQCIIHYKLLKEINEPVKILITDCKNKFIIHQELLNLPIGCNFWTTFLYAKDVIYQDVLITFEIKNDIIFQKNIRIHEFPNETIFKNFQFNNDIELFSYLEIFNKNLYSKYNIDVEENDFVVDIGSNQGAFIKYSFEKNAKKIISCEPNPNCLKVIKKYYGDYENLLINQYAISNKNDFSYLELGRDSDISGCSKLEEAKANDVSYYENTKKIKIETITFKNFILKNNILYIDYLKVDCEGGEEYIFTNENKDFIKNFVNKIVLEYHNESKNDIINNLINWGFEVWVDENGKNIGMIYAKNKNFNREKIGVIFTAYNCADYIDDCLKPWVSLKENENFKLAVNSGMFATYKELGFENKNIQTLEKLKKYNFDYFISTDDENLLDEDTSRNKCLEYLKNENCDIIWIVDGDEVYTKDQIFNILNCIKNNNQFDVYHLSFKNYTFNNILFTEFNPPRIFRNKISNKINKFYFDNHLLYEDGRTSENVTILEIPKKIAFIDHYSWLPSDSRTKEKIKYQNLRFYGPQENSKCAYLWDNESNCLKFNNFFYETRNLEIPCLHEFLSINNNNLYISYSKKECKLFIKSLISLSNCIINIKDECNNVLLDWCLNLESDIQFWHTLNYKNKYKIQIYSNDVLIHSEILHVCYQPEKYLFIAPHLSTGGSPKYLEWLIESKKKSNCEIKVLEWNVYSYDYTVQRNNIINIIGQNNFKTVGGYWESEQFFIDKENEIIDFINSYDPDYIHLNEFSEDFAIRGFTKNIINFLYNKNRKFKLYETCHKAYIDFNKKTNIPDELWLCSEFHYQKAKLLNFNIKNVEMDLPLKNRPDRNQVLQSLNLDPNKLHVLQVGLFSINKNQKFTFDLAKKFIGQPVEFHFIGNTCYIDECNINKNQSNCKIWGERNDVDVFLSCMDLFVMPSLEELNPISIKEALSWGLPCFISNIETLYKKYVNNSLIHFIENDNLLRYIESQYKNLLNSKVNKELNKINITYYPSPKIEIIGNDNCEYIVKFIDSSNGFCHYETKITNNMWSEVSIKYFVDWKMQIKNLTHDFEFESKIDLSNKVVHIVNESSSLGDTIAWMSSIDRFQKKHKCIVNYFTSKKDLFSENYSNINFYDYNDDKKNINAYVLYKIGCFNDKNLINKDWKSINLQNICDDILGLQYNFDKPKIKINKNYKNNFSKYVCIATQSTSQSRYWNKEGWEEVINDLHKKGYKVICVDRDYSYGNGKFMNVCPNNVDLFAGSESFDNIINIIDNCEFFIGLSSGLSWLSWALNKKVILISGSVSDYFEFYTPYRITNYKVCNGCFNNPLHEFDSSNWSWCPENKNFECSKNISVKSVIEKIDSLLQFKQKIKNKIKIVHLQTNLHTEKEIQSKDFIEKFKEFGIEYVNYKNKLYDGDEYLNNCLYPSLLNSNTPDKLTKNHYGCYDSFKKAIINEFDDCEFLIICEGDCKFEISHEHFLDLLENASQICIDNNIQYFSFGDTKTLDYGVLQSNIISVPQNQNLCYITDKIIGIQCIMFHKNIKNILIESLNKDQWYVMDGWFNEFCSSKNIKQGILFNRVTSQYDGISFIDKKYKTFNIL